MLKGTATITLNKETMLTIVQAWIDAHWKGDHAVRVVKVFDNRHGLITPSDFLVEIESVPDAVMAQLVPKIVEAAE